MSEPSQGYLLHQLTAAVRAALPQKCQRNLDAWMENGTLQLSPSDQGLGVNVARLQYDAVLSIEALPFRDVNPATLLAVVAAWLQDNDHEREELELPDPTYVVTPNDDNTADLDMTISFSEPLRLLPDEAGPVLFNGRRYRVAPYPIELATEGTVAVNQGAAGPLAEPEADA